MTADERRIANRLYQQRFYYNSQIRGRCPRCSAAHRAPTVYCRRCTATRSSEQRERRRMASEQLKAAVDRLQQATAAERDKLKSGASAPQTPEQALGLKFNRGDTVRDLLTGLRGTVRSGQNGQVFGRALYQIDLADGRISFRSEGELEKDTTPAPAPGR